LTILYHPYLLLRFRRDYYLFRKHSQKSKIQNSKTSDQNSEKNGKDYLIFAGLTYFGIILLTQVNSHVKNVVIGMSILIQLLFISRKNVNSYQLKNCGLAFLLSCLCVLILAKTSTELREFRLQIAYDGAKSRNYEKAIRNYQIQIELEPQNAPIRTDLALLLDSVGEVEKAYEYNRYVIDQLDENNLRALIGTAKYFEFKKNYPEVCKLQKKIEKRIAEDSALICHDLDCGSDREYARTYGPRLIPFFKSVCK